MSTKDVRETRAGAIAIGTTRKSSASRPGTTVVPETSMSHVDFFLHQEVPANIDGRGRSSLAHPWKAIE
jgi:hypothetical protein